MMGGLRSANYGPMDRWVRYYGEKGDELHLPFNFRLIYQPWQAAAFRSVVEEMEEVLPEFAWPNYVLGNHDGPRLASRYGGQSQARLAAMMLLTLRGTPTLYYGDELGMQNGVIPPEKIQDPQGVNLGPARTRDVCRTPMQWDAGEYAGFSTIDPWLPISEDYSSRNVEAMLGNPFSILNLYRKLLTLRKGSTALQTGLYQAVDPHHENCFVYRRRSRDEDYLIALNFSGEQQNLSLAEEGQADCLLSTYLDREDKIRLADFSLRPFEGLIVSL